MLASTLNKGFQLTFENELTISVQFGSGNYCERKIGLWVPNDEMKYDIVKSSNAEIAIWDKNGKWFNFGSDEVKGWVEANEIAKWIYLVSTVENLDDLYSKVGNGNNF